MSLDTVLKRTGLWAALAAAGVGGAAVAQERPKEPNTRPYVPLRAFKLPLDWKHFYSYDETVETIKRLQRTFPRLCSIEVIGKSYQGRDIWAMTLGNPKAGALERKPAMYVDGNIHGNEIQGTEICLYIAWSLLNRYGNDPAITELLDTRTFYLVPSINVDARADFFRNPNTPHSPRWNYRPKDNDLDGLEDEDGPKDIDGDGRILTMRRKDPFGRLKQGSDPRIMVPAEFGERGEFSVLGTEGVDQDGDGQVAEDGPGGVDLNRNFPALWRPEHQQFGAGAHPLSEPEIRAVAMFMYGHKNIAAVQSFHNNGNLILHPPGAVSRTTLPGRDLQVYTSIGRRGELLLPGYKLIDSAVDLYPTYGSTLDFAYRVCGAIGFTNEIWNLPREFQAGEGQAARAGQAEQLRFLDVLTRGQGWVPWKAFRHPIFGEIELGGADQFSTRIPPIDYLEDICQRNMQFVLFHAESTPLLRLHDVRVTRAGDNVWRVEAEVANMGAMDSMPEGTRESGAYRPVIAEITAPAGVTVVQGAERGELSPVLDQEREVRPGLRRRNEARVDLGTIPGLSRKTVQWLVVTPSGAAPRITVSARGQKAGEVTREVELR